MDESTSDHTHPPSRQQAAVGGSRASSKATHAPSANLEAGKRAPHTQTSPRSVTGQVPAFHLAALLRVRRWSRWSRLYGVWVPGAAQPSRWLLRTIWLGYAIQFARRPPKFGSSTSQQWRQPMPTSCERNHCPTGEGRDGTGPSSRYEGRVFQPLLHCAQESGGLRPILGLRILNGAFHKPPFKMLMQNCVFGCIRPQVRSAALTWKTRTSMCRSFRTTGHSCGWHSKEEHISTGPALRAVPVSPSHHESSGGSPCSPERTGRAHSQLPRRLAYTSSVVGPVMRTQGQGALAPQPVGPSGQLGKEQNSPRCRGSLFSVWS